MQDVFLLIGQRKSSSSMTSKIVDAFLTMQE